MWAWLSQSSFASQAVGWQNSLIVFGNAGPKCSLKDHSMPNTCSHNILTGDYLAFSWRYKSRHHLIKHLQTLILKNEVTQQVQHFHKRQIFWTELFGWYVYGIFICEYLSFIIRLAKLFAYSESTEMPLYECPVLLSFFFSFWIFM